MNELRQRLRLSSEDAAIAPLGTPGESVAGDQTLLAGRFADEQMNLVRAFVNRSGGEVVADVDEQWTRPPAAPPAPEPQTSSRTPSRSAKNTTRSRDRERQAVTN